MKTTQPDGIRYFIISRMLEVKEHLTTVSEELVGKPQRGSMEALILLTETLRPSVCVVLVIVLVLSC